MFLFGGMEERALEWRDERCDQRVGFEGMEARCMSVTWKEGWMRREPCSWR